MTVLWATSSRGRSLQAVVRREIAQARLSPLRDWRSPETRCAPISAISSSLQRRRASRSNGAQTPPPRAWSRYLKFLDPARHTITVFRSRSIRSPIPLTAVTSCPERTSPSDFSCQASLFFEPDAALDIRVHEVHDRSDRFPGNVRNCALCHLTPPDGPARGLLGR